MAEEEFEDPAQELAWEIGDAMGRALQAEGMQACPYYPAMSGKCRSGCYDEPRCITDEPLNGWAGEQRKAQADLERLLAPALAPGAWLDREGN